VALTASTPATALPPTAGVGRRTAAALIDLAIIVGGEIAALIVGGILIQATGVSSANLSAGHVGVAAALARAVTQSALYLGPIVYLYVGWRRGATVGMRARECSLRSADKVTPPTSSQVVLRLCGLFYSLLFAGVGLAWGLVRSDRRGWSDLFAGTVVIHAPRWPTSVAPTWASPTWGGPAWAAPTWPAPAWQPAPPPLPPAMPPPLQPQPSPTPPPTATWPASAHQGASLAVAATSSTTAAAEGAPWTWTDVAPVVVLLLPLSYAVEFVTVAAVKWMLGGLPLNTRRPIEALVSGITAYGAIFLMVLLFVKVRRHASLAALGIRRVQWRWILAALPFIFLAFVLESITGLFSQSLFPQAPANQCIDIRNAYQGALWMAIIGVAIVAPVVEEIVFRGMVFGWLRGRLPVVWAVAISAALFSLEHIGFLQVTLFLPIFSTGIVLAILYQHARSVWPTVLVHGSFNLIATLVLFSSVSC
jgi:uncharacterized protein